MDAPPRPSTVTVVADGPAAGAGVGGADVEQPTTGSTIAASTTAARRGRRAETRWIRRMGSLPSSVLKHDAIAPGGRCPEAYGSACARVGVRPSTSIAHTGKHSEVTEERFSG